MEILNIYRTRKIEEINKKSCELEEIKTGKKELREKIQKIAEEIEEERKEKLEKLFEEIREIEAQLELAETYEQKIDVLVNYNVLDKKTLKIKI